MRQDATVGAVTDTTASGPLITVKAAADLTGLDERRIRKAISSGKLPATEETVQEGRHKGRIRYSVALADLFAYAPAARAAWEQAQADLAARQVMPVATRQARPALKRDPLQVVLRANPASLERAQVIQRARLALLEKAVRPAVASLPEGQRRRAKAGLPGWVRTDALSWLLGSVEGQQLLPLLGGAPSASTLNRWWRALVADPSGDALKPRHSACGRPRATDLTPGLEDEIRGAYAYTGSFRGAAEVLQQKGYSLSEATVRRRLSELDPAILLALRKGERKALTDLGPYVRRRPSLPFQCWSIDGHTLDALVLWDDPLPGEKLDPFRPQLYVVRDVGSGAILACQIGHGLNRYLPLMAIADAILHFGVIPEAIQPDNGSEVRNVLFEGDEDLVGYWAQLGMDWKDGQALVHHALPYNSRSKPVERDFRTLTEGFSARLPAYVGGSPSARPGAPLAAAKAGGHFETVASLKARLNAWLGEKIQQERIVQRRRITPCLALQEMRDRLVQELGADHPRFVRPGQEWRVLPGLRARLVRGFVCARIEGQDLRFHTPVLDGLDVDGLTVRINPWDITQAWLCRGNELLDALTYVPDGPELGAGSTDVVALRIAKNIERRQKGIIRQATLLQERNRREAGMLTGHQALAAAPVEPPRELGRDLTQEQQALAAQIEAQLGLQAIPQLDPALGRPAPAERRHIQDDLDWALFVLNHPEQADPEEIRELNAALRSDSDPTLRLRLTQALGAAPSPIPLPKEA